MGDMVSDEVEVLARVAGQSGLEELGCPGRIRGAQVFPGGVEAARSRVDQGGVVGVGDSIKIIRSQPALGQAPGDRLLRAAPRQRTGLGACRACDG